MSPAEHVDAAGFPAEESVTLYEYVAADAGVARYEEEVAPEIRLPLAQPDDEYHW